MDNFKVINNKLYYVKQAEHSLYSSDLDGTNEQKLSDHEVANWYDVIDGTLYYTVTNTKEQINLYKVEPNHEDTLVLADPLDSVQVVNNKLICKLTPGESYGIKILGESGDVALSITDKVSIVFAYNNLMLIVTSEDKSIKVVHLF